MKQMYDVTSSFVHVLDADRAQAEEVLAQIDPMRSLADRLSALGLDDRAVWSRGAEPGTHTLAWRFGPAGYGRLDWELSVTSDARDRAVLTVRLGARGSTPEARTQVLRAWLFVEELAAGHARRLARTIGEYANADEYDAPPLSLFRAA